MNGPPFKLTMFWNSVILENNIVSVHVEPRKADAESLKGEEFHVMSGPYIVTVIFGEYKIAIRDEVETWIEAFNYAKSACEFFKQLE